MSDLLEAVSPTWPSPPPCGGRVTTIHGQDVREIRPHWRGTGAETSLRTIELLLAGGDVVLLDLFALRILVETEAQLRASRGR